GSDGHRRAAVAHDDLRRRDRHSGAGGRTAAAGPAGRAQPWVSLYGHPADGVGDGRADRFPRRVSWRAADRGDRGVGHGLRLRHVRHDGAVWVVHPGLAAAAPGPVPADPMRPDFFRFLCSPWLWVPVIVAALLPYGLSSYHLAIGTLALLYVSLALSWNIVGGMAGQISLTHSVFVGCGAIFASSLLVQLGINLWIGMAIAATVSAAIGVFIALVDSRFRLGHLSFALVTLAFAEIGELVVSGSDFLGGASGVDLPKDRGLFWQFQFGGR